MAEIFEEVLEDGIIGKASNTNSHRHFFDGRPFDEENGCKFLLHRPLGDDIRAWDVLVLVPNLVFFAVLCFGFPSARTKLRADPSSVFRTFYGLVLAGTVLGVLRGLLAVSLVGLKAANAVDEVSWLAYRFCLLTAEMSVLVFGTASGRAGSRGSAKRVLIFSVAAASSYVFAMAFFELAYPDSVFTVESSGYRLFGHGGALFLALGSIGFALIYVTALLLPLLPGVRSCVLLSLPRKSSFYYYAGFLAALNAVQAAGAVMVYRRTLAGFCVIDLTTYVYFTAYIPALYFTFVRGFLNVTQPTLLFSYRAQVDDELNDPHQSSQFDTLGRPELDEERDTNPIIINGFSNGLTQSSSA